jgi:hypothetical protein
MFLILSGAPELVEGAQSKDARGRCDLQDAPSLARIPIGANDVRPSTTLRSAQGEDFS